MDDKLIESEFIKNNVTNQRKHLAIFSFVVIILIILYNIIGQDFNPGTIEMKVLDIISLIDIPLLSIIIFRTYRTKEKLKYDSKVGFISIIILVSFIATFIFNLANPFNRIIDNRAIIKGIYTTLLGSIFSFILCLPILAIVKNKTITKTT